MPPAQRNNLLVEGTDDLYAVVELMAHYVQWSKEKEKAPVKIDACGSVNNILNKAFLSTKIKSREIDVIGIVIDADNSFESRWSSLRDCCIGFFPSLPRDLPSSGLIAENADGKRLGVWIMPDNRSRGMLETFLGFLVPSAEEPLWRKAKGAVEDARASGARCRDCHIDKSNIHTWLAWQDPPGQSLGTALLQRILDARAPHAEPFVTWFCNLYRLEPQPPSR